jgi:hypothetical protein
VGVVFTIVASPFLPSTLPWSSDFSATLSFETSLDSTPCAVCLSGFSAFLGDVCVSFSSTRSAGVGLGDFRREPWKVALSFTNLVR